MCQATDGLSTMLNDPEARLSVPCGNSTHINRLTAQVCIVPLKKSVYVLYELSYLTILNNFFVMDYMDFHFPIAQVKH